jgi:predicted lipid-binding transport protein (Tim44 family)
MRFPHGPGFGAFGGIIESVVAGMFFLLCFAVVVGLLFVLVRFLLIATKAAEIYVAKNSTAQPVAPATTAPAATTPVTTTTASTTPIATAPVTKPTPRTRTPKPPTAS